MITIREAETEDLEGCASMRASYTTRSSWQITTDGEALRTSDVAPAGVVLSFHLQQVRLPQTRELRLPSAATPLTDAWNGYDGRLVALLNDTLCGYLLLQTITEQRQGMIARLLVEEQVRGLGVGKALVQSARGWATTRGVISLLAHAPLRNVSGIHFYQRCGFHVCGLCQQFYPTREDALLLRLVA